MIIEQLEKDQNNKYSVHLKNGETKKFRKSEIETFMSYIKNNRDVAEVVISGSKLDVDDELKHLLLVCKNSGYKSILEFVNYDDNYLQDLILKDLENMGVETLLFRFEYEKKGSHNYLMADKGLMINVVKSILNASMFNFDIELFITPLKSNYKQLADVYMLANEIGISRIHLGNSKKYGSTLELSENELAQLKFFLNNINASATEKLGTIEIKMQLGTEKEQNRSL